jgi:hypothetical protein
VAIANLPTGCTATATSQNYSGLATGGTVTVPAFQVNCATAGSGKYELGLTWGAISGGQATATVKIDMTGRNDPNNNGTGPDKIGAFQASFIFPAARLSSAVCTGQTGFSGVFNTSQPDRVTAVLTNLAGASGSNVVLLTCTFAVAGTGPTTLTVQGLLGANETGAINLTPFINVTVSPLP